MAYTQDSSFIDIDLTYVIDHIYLRVLQDRKDKTISEGVKRASKPLVVLLTLYIQSEKCKDFMCIDKNQFVLSLNNFINLIYLDCLQSPTSYLIQSFFYSLDL